MQQSSLDGNACINQSDIRAVACFTVRQPRCIAPMPGIAKGGAGLRPRLFMVVEVRKPWPGQAEASTTGA